MIYIFTSQGVHLIIYLFSYCLDDHMVSRTMPLSVDRATSCYAPTDM
jgi:hypothetical protein